jgi:hypothetical protein
MIDILTSDLFVLGTILLIAFYPYLLGHFKKNKIRKLEYNESLHGESDEEPRPYRSLTEDERAILRKQYDQIRPWVHHPLLHFGSVILTFFLSIYFYNRIFEYMEFYYQATPSTQGYILLAVCSLTAIWMMHNLNLSERELYQDLNLPAWKVQGRFVVIKKTKKNGRIVVFSFSVRKIGFTVTEPDALLKSLAEVHEGTEIVVVYSPFSHIIWLIEEVVDTGNKNLPVKTIYKA